MVLFTGGKTGGHIMPLINLIKTGNKDSIYVGYKGFLEEKICRNNGITFIGIPNSSNKYTSIIKGVFYLIKKLKKIKIKAVVSSGGFVSAPLILYAIVNKIPFYLLEENLIIGRFNEFFYRKSKGILLAHPLKKMKKRYIHTGIPIVKKDIKEIKKYDVVIIGGSLGSKPLCNIASMIKNKYNVLLIAGRYQDEYENQGFDSISFSDDLFSIMYNSKLIISRAGAMTTYEAMYLNKPLIIIPSENTKRNHQVINARFFDDMGIGIMIRENEIEEKLLKTIDNILTNPNLRIDMKIKQKGYIINDSSERIWKLINEL